jgi:hypothetical protein
VLHGLGRARGAGGEHDERDLVLNLSAGGQYLSLPVTFEVSGSEPFEFSLASGRRHSTVEDGERFPPALTALNGAKKSLGRLVVERDKGLHETSLGPRMRNGTVAWFHG